jgi:hypothetical protein
MRDFRASKNVPAWYADLMPTDTPAPPVPPAPVGTTPTVPVKVTPSKVTPSKTRSGSGLSVRGTTYIPPESTAPTEEQLRSMPLEQLRKLAESQEKGNQ